MEPTARTPESSPADDAVGDCRWWSAKRAARHADSGPTGIHKAVDAGKHTGVRLPVLLTVDEAADLLRTTRRAIYAMVERRQLPGVIRIRRRVLLRADDLLHWLDQKRASSPKE
jgi:excisionase family DNA binding protein